MADSVSPAAAGLGLGIALASAPGPVQAVLLSESIRGGVARGFRAMAGASVTFGVLLVALALGVSVAAPSGALLRILEIAGGALLVVLAVDGFKARPRLEQANGERRELPPVARGSLAVLLNPGAWLFLGTAGSSLFAAAIQEGGTDAALLAALALVIGLAAGDGAVVLIGGLGVRRAGERVGLWVRRGLAVVLAALGVALIVRGVVS
jgi:threonine/homoserine/homoserine lactone efflux protein